MMVSIFRNVCDKYFKPVCTAYSVGTQTIGIRTTYGISRFVHQTTRRAVRMSAKPVESEKIKIKKNNPRTI